MLLQMKIKCYQNERLAALTNKDDHKYKETFEKLVKERFVEMKELTYEINHEDLTYYFKK